MDQNHMPEPPTGHDSILAQEWCDVQDAKRDIQAPTACHASLLCPGYSQSVALRRTIAGPAPAAQHAR